MFKKVIWIFILLIMTACTIVFSDQLDFDKNGTEPVELEPFVPTDEMVSIGEAFESATSVVDEIPFPTFTKSPEELPVEETVEVISEEIRTNYKYIVQEGSPKYTSNFNYLDKGCAWQGVAGQVFGKDNVPVKELVVKVFGTWNGEEISSSGVTGMVEGRPYGRGSFEIVLGDIAIDSTEPLYIQIFNARGIALSEPFQFVTKAKCNRNLVVINFVRK